MTTRKGVSVTTFIKKVYQPFGGFLKNEDFVKTQFNDNKRFYPSENINASYVGLIVDYMTRFMMTGDAVEAFHISLIGAGLMGEYDKAVELAESITGLDSQSISTACTLIKYDIAYRVHPSEYDPQPHIYPDAPTISNIIVMVERTLEFFEKQNVIETNVVFPGAYNDVIATGDGDFLTEDAIWDLKVSKYPPTSYNTLQTLIYQILLYRSANRFVNIGIFNPKLNCSYYYDMRELDPLIYEAVESLIDNKPCTIISRYDIGDEIKTIGIGVKENKTRYYNRVNIEQLADDIAKGIINPDDLYFTIAYIQVKDKVGNILEGEVTGSSYKFIMREQAKYTEQYVWRLYNRDFFDYDFFMELLTKKGLTKIDLFNRFSRLRYVESTVRWK